MHDPQPCACTTITLDAATLVDLRARYAGCLCLSCMHALSVAAATNDRTAERS
jgi:hypothetical protein